jgi:hypothetical protein
MSKGMVSDVSAIFSESVQTLCRNQDSNVSQTRPWAVFCNLVYTTAISYLVPCSEIETEQLVCVFLFTNLSTEATDLDYSITLLANFL